MVYRQAVQKRVNCSIQILGVLLLLTSVNVSAQVKDIISSNNQIKIQYINTRVNYTETIGGAIADTEKGHVPGFGVTFSAMKDIFFGNDFFEAQVSRLSGNTNYSGSLGVLGIAVGPLGYGPYAQTNGAQMTDYSLKFGKGFSFANNTSLITPYIELGNHQWDRKIASVCLVTTNPCSTNATENYQNYYYGLGIMGQISPMEKLVLTTNLMVGNTFSSTISATGQAPLVVSIPYLVTSFNAQKLGSEKIYKLGLSADYAFTKYLHGSLGVDYTAFKYGRSAPFVADQLGIAFYEPDSKTRYTTFKVGIGYGF